MSLSREDWRQTTTLQVRKGGGSVWQTKLTCCRQLKALNRLWAWEMLFSDGEDAILRCYCNDTACVRTGYMCRTCRHEVAPESSYGTCCILIHDSNTVYEQQSCSSIILMKLHQSDGYIIHKQSSIHWGMRDSWEERIRGAQIRTNRPLWRRVSIIKHRSRQCITSCTAAANDCRHILEKLVHCYGLLYWIHQIYTMSQTSSVRAVKLSWQHVYMSISDWPSYWFVIRVHQ